MHLSLISGPSSEPISLAEAKLHLKAETTDDDALIGTIIAAARELAEQRTDRALVDQRWERVLDVFPDAIQLARPPLVSVESLKYVDVNGVQQTIASTDYAVDDVSEPGYILPAFGTSWPSSRAEANAIRARFIGGYAAAIASVDATADTLTHAGLRTLVNDQVLRLSNSGGALPAPLVAGTEYYAKNVASKTFQVAATAGGSAINLTDTGSGVHYVGEVPKLIRQWMLIAMGFMYEYREPIVTGAVVSRLEFVDRMLDRYTLPRL